MYNYFYVGTVSELFDNLHIPCDMSIAPNQTVSLAFCDGFILDDIDGETIKTWTFSTTPIDIWEALCIFWATCV